MIGMGTVLLVAVLWCLAIAILAATFLPMWKTSLWWVRILDFPRLQIAILSGLVLVAALFLSGPSRLLIPALMLAACGYQLWRIRPYTAFHPVEMNLAPHAPDEIRVLSANVLMENARHDLLLKVVEAFDPDILLLMETDRTWMDAVEPVLARYSTVLREPRPDHYGMLFATRLAVDEARIIRLTTGDTPSVFAQLKGPDGTVFRFAGLHPRPPVPGQDTEERDAEIYYAARFAAKSGVPLIATGDFNDVAWSDTSQSFKHVGQYLDPQDRPRPVREFRCEEAVPALPHRPLLRHRGCRRGVDRAPRLRRVGSLSHGRDVPAGRLLSPPGSTSRRVPSATRSGRSSRLRSRAPGRSCGIRNPERFGLHMLLRS